MEEIWKDIKDFEGIYQVSSFGRIKSLQMYANGGYKKREKILKPCNNGNGYFIVYLRKDKKRYVKYIHRLVAEAFIFNPNNYKCINHKNEIKTDNKKENLEWCTYKYNNNYGKHNEKLSKSKRKLVNQYDLQGNFIRTWDGIRIAMEETNSRHIVECCKNKIKSSGGYIWRYYETDNERYDKNIQDKGIRI